MCKAQLGRPRITTDEVTCSAIRAVVYSFYRKKSILMWTLEEAVEKLIIELNSDDDENTDDDGDDVYGLPC